MVVYKSEGIYRSWDEIPGDLVITSGNYFGKKCMVLKHGKTNQRTTKKCFAYYAG